MLQDHFSRTYGAVVHCHNCGKTMQRIPAKVSADIFPQDGLFLHNVSSTGKRFFSKGEIKEFEKHNDIYIDCAHD
jgi:hypothetical protein